MTDTLDVQVVAQRIVDAALELFHAHGSALRVARPDGSLVGLAFGGPLKELFAIGHVIPAGRASVSGLAMLSEDAVWSDDTFADTRLEIPDELSRGMQATGDAARS